MIQLTKHEITTSIRDRYANITYSFSFENTNQSDRSDELRFEITIDPNAFISKFEADIDGELFVGQTKEKETAAKDYSAAKKKNENAVLISQPYDNIPNVFEIKTNIDSKSKIHLTVQIEQYLQKKLGNNELNIQILRNFNYSIKQKFDHISFVFDIEDDSGICDIKLPNQKSDKQSINDGQTKCVINGEILKNSAQNELTLQYKTKGESEESHILFDKHSNTFCHVISDIMNESTISGVNEGKQSTDVIIPRRVIFVVDRSGSMSGSKWKKTIAATIHGIRQLRQYDRFSIILFDDKLELLPYKSGCVLAQEQSVFDSVSALQQKEANGSTDIQKALLKAIELIKSDILLLNNDDKCEYNFFTNQIILITDGEPNEGERDTNKIVMNVKVANDLKGIDEYNKKISIFAFGVGSETNDSKWINDLNHSFLKILSVNNNAFYQRIKQTRTEETLNAYFDVLSKPLLTDIKIKYEDQHCTDFTKTSFDTLFTGNDLIICGKLQTHKTFTMTANISAITGQKCKQSNGTFSVKPIEINKTLKIELNDALQTISNDDEKTENKTKSNNVERIWAYLTLKQLSDQRLMNDDMIEYDEDDDTLPLSLAMKYEFITAWTSMIVVKHKSDKTEEHPKHEKHKHDFDHNTCFLPSINLGGDLGFDCKAAFSDTEDWGGLDEEDCPLTIWSGGPNPVSFEIPQRCAENSKFVTTILEGDADATSIEIRQVLPETLAMVVQYLNNCEEKTWNAILQWIDSFDMETVLKIINAANYMDIESLSRLGKAAVKRKEVVLNKLIDDKLLFVSRRKQQRNEAMCIVDELLSVFESKDSKGLKDCTVVNMVYLVQKIMAGNVLGLNGTQKARIGRYFEEIKVDAKMFVSLAENNEFVQNAMSDCDEQRQEKEKISFQIWKRLESDVLAIIN